MRDNLLKITTKLERKRTPGDLEIGWKQMIFY
jgi:hypothetical protein